MKSNKIFQAVTFMVVIRLNACLELMLFQPLASLFIILTDATETFRTGLPKSSGRVDHIFRKKPEAGLHRHFFGSIKVFERFMFRLSAGGIITSWLGLETGRIG